MKKLHFYVTISFHSQNRYEAGERDLFEQQIKMTTKTQKNNLMIIKKIKKSVDIFQNNKTAAIKTKLAQNTREVVLFGNGYIS